MRKNIVAGNWKMNTTLAEAEELSNNLVNLLGKENTIKPEIIIAPPFVNLFSVKQIISKSPIALSAQNAAAEEKGAFTGEVSAEMIKAVGCQYVIIGHSERRSIFGEQNAVLQRKTEVALKHGLKIIFCIGERLLEREKNEHFKVIEEQLSKAIFNLNENDFRQVIIAYEPVWAIGTGVTASPAQAQEMHAYIRSLVEKNYNSQVAEDTSILYGGSCKPGNAKELFVNEDVDGGLIGGASLKADDFLAIIKAFN